MKQSTLLFNKAALVLARAPAPSPRQDALKSSGDGADSSSSSHFSEAARVYTAIRMVPYVRLEPHSQRLAEERRTRCACPERPAGYGR